MKVKHWLLQNSTASGVMRSTLCKRSGCCLIEISRSLSTSLARLISPAAGKLLLSMLAAVAEMERDLLIERTQAGLSRAKAEGKKLGRPSKIAAEAQGDCGEKE